MSESIGTSLVSDTPTTENIVTTSTEDVQNIQVAYQLNGNNYLKWSQLVRTFLKGKGKLSHLLGKGPSKDDPKFVAWDEQDSMVMSWLWNLMLLEISNMCIFLGSSKEI